MAVIRLIASETLFYCLFTPVYTGVVLSVLLLLLSPSVAAVWGFGAAAAFVKRAAIFTVVLVICGIPANAIFVTVLRDRFYVAADPIVDWMPWLPSGDWVLDIACGGRYVNGGSAWLLRVVWGVLAAPTWVTAIMLYRRFLSG